ncbi:MAG: sulfurtransferase [Nitrospirae bacterium]|nr:sulfurtransferase [Nitrospirota bacterium]
MNKKSSNINKKKYYIPLVALGILLIAGIIYLSSNRTKPQKSFEISNIKSLNKIVFSLPNMDKEMCNTFPKRIVTSLEGLEGVVDASFNFSGHFVTAYYDPQFISKKTILTYDIYSWTKVDFISDESVPVSLAKTLYKNREKDDNPVMPKNGMADITPVENQKMIDAQNFPSLVSAKWLFENLGNVKVIEIGPAKEYDKGHIKGAVNIQIGDIRATEKGIAEQIISKKYFEPLMDKIGISNSDRVVIYSSESLNQESRLYETLKYYGHKNIAIVNGGKNLIDKKYLTTAKTKIIPSNYTAKVNENIIVDSDYVLSKLNNSGTGLLDVRSEGEFNTGHIPGAVNINWENLLNSDGTLKSLAELKSILKNIDKNKEIIVYCVSGTRASYMWFVLTEVLGYKNVKVFDGSMIAWKYKNLPLEK